MASRRRGHGEGSIYQRGDGRWVGVVTLDDPGTTRKRKSVYGRTRAEVAAKLAQVQARVVRGEAVVDERVLLGEFLDDWLETVKANREYATYLGYEQRVRRCIKPALGRRPLAKLTAADVQRLLNSVRAEGLSPRSVQYTHATLRAALGVAERWGLVARNVAELVEPVTVRRRQVEPFTMDEVTRLIAACRDDRLGALFTVALAVGLRPGEALALRWIDLDLEATPPVLHVRQALKKSPGGGLTFGEPKSARSRRTIPLPSVCVGALREHRARQAAERLAAGPRWQDHGLVFTSTIGTPLDVTAASRRFGALQDAADVPRHRLYDARHTAASIQLEDR